MGLNEKQVKERVYEAIGFVHLDEALLEKSPFELSGGQKRRAAIAGVMAMMPEVLILDEPTAGLDPRGRDEILKNIMNYKEAIDATLIIVTHNMDEIVRTVKNAFCDKTTTSVLAAWIEHFEEKYEVLMMLVEHGKGDVKFAENHVIKLFKNG
jgi:energy-coupling factor transporter ATP-binding protein EcfA2